MTARRFEYHPVPSTFPAGAWVARLVDRRPLVDVWAGRSVVRGDGWFFEGVWSGSLADGPGHGPGEFRFGSGALVGSGVRLLCPTHPYRGLWGARSPNGLVVSNSLVALARSLGARPRFPAPEAFNQLRSLWSQPTEPATTDLFGLPIERWRAVEVDVDPDGRIDVVPSVGHLPITTYERFVDDVVDVLAAMRRNGTDPARPTPLTDLASFSRGYDSPAASALAARAGWASGFTFTDEPGDDGTEIARGLGYDLRRVDARRWVDAAAEVLPEMLTGEGPYVMGRLGAVDDLATDTMFVTGSYSTYVWSTQEAHVTGPGFRRAGRNNDGVAGLAEWELRHGSVAIHVATIGGADPAPLHRIIERDLGRWSIGGDYDKPLARRIVEDAGIDREAFGMEKFGSSHVRAPHDFPSGLRAEFDDWLADRPAHPAQRAAVETAARLAARVAPLTERLPGDVGARVHLAVRIRRALRWESAHTWHWAVDRTSQRYRAVDGCARSDTA